MKLTVAICTWNRSALLRATLERVTKICPPACEWEVIVVNNACNDDTDSVIAEFSGRLPLKRVFEPRQGLSCARNAAISAASGDYILWTDDDVLVGDDWFSAYESAIFRYPDVVVLGGPVLPWFDGHPPEWIARSWTAVQGAFALRDLGSEEILLNGGASSPFGANFVVRTSEQRRFPYDEHLGRKGTGGALGEESAVISRILAADKNATGRWIPNATVRHWVPRHRQTVRYVWKYFYLQGRTMSLMESPDPGTPKILGRPRWQLRALGASLIPLVGTFFPPDPNRWPEALFSVARAVGRLSIRSGVSAGN